MSVLVIPKAPFPSFTLVLSGQNVSFKEEDGLDNSVQLPARGAQVDLMKTLDLRMSHSWNTMFTSDDDNSDTETIFEVRPERSKLRGSAVQSKGLVYLPKFFAILRVLTCFCGKSRTPPKKHQ